MMRNALAAALLLAGTTALAQTTGTLQITGSTQPAVSMKYMSATTNLTTPGSSFTNTDPLNSGQLNAILNFGEVTSGVNGTVQWARLDFAMRSNTSYTISSTVTSNVASQVLTMDDIGFALTAYDASGVNVVTPRADVFITPVVAPGSNWTIGADGNVTWGTTLSTLAAPAAELLSGNRISARGSFLTPTNAITLQTEFAVLPQLFSYDPLANTFDYTVTLTMTSP